MVVSVAAVLPVVVETAVVATRVVVVRMPVGAGTVGGANEVVGTDVVTGDTKVIVCCVVAGGINVVSGAGRVVRDTAVLVDTGGLQAARGSNRRTAAVSPIPTLTPTFDMYRIITLFIHNQPIGKFC